MTRFVRLYHNPKDDPGSRLRLEYDPDLTEAFCIADENVLAEKTFDEDATRVQNVACIELDRDAARWARDAFIELCMHLDEEERRAVRRAFDAAEATREVRTTLDAVDPKKGTP